MEEPKKEIFDGLEPIEIVRKWFLEAKAVEPSDPDAVALSTVDSLGLSLIHI